MKNKKRVIIISILVTILFLAIVTVILTNHFKTNIYDTLQNMIELNSYNVVVSSLDLEYANEEEELQSEIYSDISIDGKIEKIQVYDNISYFYNDKKVVSEKDNNDNLTWYYSSSYNSSISKIEVPYYKNIYEDLFNQLKNYKFNKNGNTFSFKNEKYLDEDGDEWQTIWDVDSELNGFVEEIYGIIDGSSFYPLDSDYGWIEKVPVLNDIEIVTKKNYITKIEFTYIAECYDENEEYLDCEKFDEDGEMYKLIIEFKDHNNVKVELPDDVLNSLNKTTAGNWIGTYKGNIVCSDGNSYEEKLELTERYRIHSEVSGWDIEMRGYSCDYNYYTSQERTYNLVDDKLIVYDMFGKTIVEFEYQDGKIIEYDENNNIITTFIKE